MSKESKQSPVISEKENEELPDNDASGTKDMSHVESFLDGLSDDEMAHAHEHLKKKMESPESALNTGEPGYESFMKLKEDKD